MILVKKDNSAICISIQVKNFDLENAIVIRSEFSTLDLTNVENVIIDMDNVKFIDSSAISALIFLYKKNEGNITMINVKENVVSVIEMMGLHRIFDIV